MRRITIWTLSTVVIVVLLFTYHTSTSGPSSNTASGGGQQAPGVVSTPAPTATSTHRAAPTPPKSSNVTVNGTVAQTQWGPVQVQVHISGNKITDVQALVYPTGSGRDLAINSYALPRLREQVLQAQSANIDGVSGATVTTGGYVESLQAALSAAHFGA